MTSIVQINNLLSTSYIPDTVLNAEDKEINESHTPYILV